MNIFVTKLNPATSEEDLFDLFKRYGRVISVKLVTDRDSGLSKGIAYIDMEDEMEARSAINALNGSEFQGNLIVMKVARPKEEGVERRKSIGGDRRKPGSGDRRKSIGGDRRKPGENKRRQSPSEHPVRGKNFHSTQRSNSSRSSTPRSTSNSSSSHSPGARHSTSNHSSTHNSAPNRSSARHSSAHRTSSNRSTES